MKLFLGTFLFVVLYILISPMILFYTLVCALIGAMDGAGECAFWVWNPIKKKLKIGEE